MEYLPQTAHPSYTLKFNLQYLKMIFRIAASVSRKLATLAPKPSISKTTVGPWKEELKSPTLIHPPSTQNYYSEFHLALLHDADNSSIQNKKIAFDCFKSVAAKGHADAQYFVGEYYLLGTGVEKNETEGFRYVKLAADQGVPHAMYGVGSMYMLGVGVAANREAGINYMRQASRLGHIQARQFLHSK